MSFFTSAYSAGSNMVSGAYSSAKSTVSTIASIPSAVIDTVSEYTPEAFASAGGNLANAGSEMVQSVPDFAKAGVNAGKYLGNIAKDSFVIAGLISGGVMIVPTLYILGLPVVAGHISFAVSTFMANPVFMLSIPVVSAALNVKTAIKSGESFVEGFGHVVEAGSHAFTAVGDIAEGALNVAKFTVEVSSELLNAVVGTPVVSFDELPEDSIHEVAPMTAAEEVIHQALYATEAMQVVDTVLELVGDVPVDDVLVTEAA